MRRQVKDQINLQVTTWRGIAASAALLLLSTGCKSAHEQHLIDADLEDAGMKLSQAHTPDEAKFVGKRLLFSVVYKDEIGATVDRKQGCGIITNITPQAVYLKLPDKSEFSLPPGTDFDKGVPGAKYKLKDGSVVESPDYTIIYTVHGQSTQRLIPVR